MEICFDPIKEPMEWKISDDCSFHVIFLICHKLTKCLVDFSLKKNPYFQSNAGIARATKILMSTRASLANLVGCLLANSVIDPIFLCPFGDNNSQINWG